MICTWRDDAQIPHSGRRARRSARLAVPTREQHRKRAIPGTQFAAFRVGVMPTASVSARTSSLDDFLPSHPYGFWNDGRRHSESLHRPCAIRLFCLDVNEC